MPVRLPPFVLGAQLGPRHNSNTNDITRKLHLTVLPLSKSGWEEFSLFFFDVKQCSVLCWDGKLRFAVLRLSKLGWDEFSLSFCDVSQFGAFCWEWEAPLCRSAA